jgi:putative phosphoesterase
MPNSKVRIGVIADTHGRLDRAVLDHFSGVDRIIHAGDIGNEQILWELEKIAPVIAVKGNNDTDSMCVPNERLAQFGEVSIFVTHIFSTVEKLTQAQKNLIEKRLLNAVVFGHSHKAYSGIWRGTLLFNPGAAGPKRFSLPRSIGFLAISESEVEPEILELVDDPQWV